MLARQEGEPGGDHHEFDNRSDRAGRRYWRGCRTAGADEGSTGPGTEHGQGHGEQPALLRSYLALRGAVGSGTLPAAVRERLAIASAQRNGCQYCLSAHTYVGGKVAKIDAAELDAARRAESADPHVDALLKLSNVIAANAGDVADADLAAARAAGVTDEELGELIANLALNTVTNYFNVLARTQNDWPAVQM